MGNRDQSIYMRLGRLIPPTDPVIWHYTRMQLVAAAIGATPFDNGMGEGDPYPTQDAQSNEVESQLLLGSILQRVDADPENWDTANAVDWVLEPTPDTKSSGGFFLDLWGRTLGVPREAGESDQAYAPRILSEVLRPTTTNIGLAQAIDSAIGVTGTQVLDAVDALTVYRLNSPGLRLDSPNKRYNMAGAMGGNRLEACFIVRTPSGVSAPYDEGAISRIVSRRKAAGTRMIGIYSAVGGVITAPSVITVGVSSSASVPPPGGPATYAWSITGGVIESGQGTSAISFHATSEGTLTLTVVVTDAGGTATYFKPIAAFNAVSTTIDAPQFIPSGTFRAVASIPAPGYGFTIEWEASAGLDIEGPTDQTIVTFDAGEAGTAETLTVTLRNAAGATGTANAVVKILPYPMSTDHTTATLNPGDTENFTLDLGKRWLVTAISSNAPVRVRFYDSDAHRAADAARPTGTQPTGNHGLLAEAVTTEETPEVVFAPWAYGETPTNTVYVSVTNTGTEADAITITTDTSLMEA